MSLVDDPKHVTQCPICSSRCTELFKCGKEGCGKEGCGYLCIDTDDRECFDCDFYKEFENQFSLLETLFIDYLLFALIV